MKLRSIQQAGWTRIFPRDMAGRCEPSSLRHDAIAGVTLAADAIPVSLAYAVSPGFRLRSGRRLYAWRPGLRAAWVVPPAAVGPTSAISLMIAGGVGALAGGDAVRSHRSRAFRHLPWRCFA